MKTHGIKRYVRLIVTITVGVLLSLFVSGIELYKHYAIYRLGALSKADVFQILSDAFFVPSLFLISASVIRFWKYVSITALLYSAFRFFKEMITLGFVPRSSRKAYRAYRKATREDNGLGILIQFLTGCVFLALAVIFLIMFYRV